MNNSSVLQQTGEGARAILRFATIAALALGAAGCLASNDITKGIPYDYRDRHPISLGHANEVLEIFLNSRQAQLDPRATEDVRQFGRDYMAKGQGPLIAYLPSDGTPVAVQNGLTGIRQALAGGGASGRLQIAHYQSNAGPSAPIKLVYARLKADTTTKCGWQDEEIVPTRLKINSGNYSNYNFGCSYQKNLAAQIADPRDLVRPRQEGPVDAEKRLAGIERIREGDQNELKPAGTSIKQIVGQ
ncbi:MAG: CpaD family pilus assembly protein [Methylocystis sp.]|nr:CpaD family pilus assembly protein [Methylocystis sp.]MCA3583960.1 CpaD family pilus assembly protein [Methylocystis sp.]MCA3589562.1 CpaD family pilus assembly protein [Methylocystis sp.]MCA3592464.1 CpaD family pilus assembly protein [Methylocystis sp.]